MWRAEVSTSLRLFRLGLGLAAYSLYGVENVLSPDGDQNDLDRAITVMAQSLRMTHTTGDGCVDDSELPPS